MKIDYDYALSNNIVFLKQKENDIYILSKDEPKEEIHQYLKTLTNKNIHLIHSKKYNFNKYFEEYYNISITDNEIKSEFEEILKLDIEKMLNYILIKAQDFIASDIHIISEENKVVIKFRINSILRTFAILDKQKGEALIRIIKLKSNIDISKTLSPLEGRFDNNLTQENIDYRISIMPTISGEKLTIRILGNTRDIYTFRDLGLNDEEISIIQDVINKNSGFIIITGPTGSGKSTTLFAIMHYLNDGSKNIISIEDPVEYKIDGVTQISVNKEKHIDFHNVLRFVLRQDPQIINVGEVRDETTAKLAFNSANTGHLVLSTMHTNSALSSIQRFHDLGLEPFEVVQSLSLVISQRLIRVLCPNCKEEEILSQDIIKHYNLKTTNYYKAKGCKKCYGTGYINQKAIFEILVADENVKKLISNRQINIENINIKTLKEKLLDELEKGETSIEEVSKFI